MDTRINIALVGFGKFGKKYAKTLKKNKNFLLKAIYRKNKFYRNDFHKLSKKNLKDNKIKAAIICTPVNTHFKLAKFFIEQKIPIILEKPAAGNESQIKKLLFLSKKCKSTVLINHSDLFNKNFETLISKMNMIGKIKYIEAYFGKFSKNYRDKNFLPYKDWLPHPLALILTIVKKASLKRVILNNINKKKNSFFQDISLFLKCSNNIQAKIFFSNRKKKKRRNIIVYGKKGKLNYDGYDYQNNFIEKNKRSFFNSLKPSPMDTILNKLHRLTLNKMFCSDLRLSLDVEKIIANIKRSI